ncbi:conjugal transfer pilus assembly protein TraB [Raoultella planticola]|nr:conjugal transfer pilus assembly protein TraB [Raoultella planticola]
MTGVVDSSFNSKVEQHATTEMQATAAELNKRFASLQGEVDLLSKARTADQVRLDKLGSENAAMQEQLRALGLNPLSQAASRLRYRRLLHRVRKGSLSPQIIRRRLPEPYHRRRHIIRVMARCRLHRSVTSRCRYRTRSSVKPSAMTAARKRSHSVHSVRQLCQKQADRRC